MNFTTKKNLKKAVWDFFRNNLLDIAILMQVVLFGALGLTLLIEFGNEY